MKRIVRMFLLLMVIMSGWSSCMDKQVVPDPAVIKKSQQLLADRGCLLKQLLNFERHGNFEPDVLEAEKTLQVFLDTYSSKKLREMYDKETLKLAILVAQRPGCRAQIYSAIKESDNYLELEKIISNNSHMLNAYNSEKQNLLHGMVLLDKQHCVKTLLALQVNPDGVNGCDGDSALHIAVREYKSHNIIEYLLSAGANPDLWNNGGESPFSLACSMKSSCLEVFEKHGYLFFYSLWPDRDPIALLKNRARYLTELLKEPIGSVASDYAIETVDKLFKHTALGILSIKSDIFTTTEGIVFKRASEKDCEQFFGCDVMAYAKECMLARDEILLQLSDSICKGDSKMLESILAKHAISGCLQYELLKLCLEKNQIPSLRVCLAKGFNPNRYHREISPLHYAVQYNLPQAIKYLMEYNADCIVVNHQGLTPLEYAISLGHKESKEAMFTAIKNRFMTLCNSSTWCGLSKHISSTRAKDKSAAVGYEGEFASQFKVAKGCSQCSKDLSDQIALYSRNCFKGC